MSLVYKGQIITHVMTCLDDDMMTFKWWSPKMTSNTSDGYTATASSVINASSTHLPYKAFDGDIETAWHTRAGVPQWLKIQFPKTILIKGIRMTPYAPETYPYPLLMPSDFTIVGNVDGVSVDIMSVTDASGYERGEWKEFMFPDIFEVSSITINVSNVPSTSKDGVVIGEVEFFVREDSVMST